MGQNDGQNQNKSFRSAQNPKNGSCRTKPIVLTDPSRRIPLLTLWPLALRWRGSGGGPGVVHGGGLSAEPGGARDAVRAGGHLSAVGARPGKTGWDGRQPQGWIYKQGPWNHAMQKNAKRMQVAYKFVFKSRGPRALGLRDDLKIFFTYSTFDLFTWPHYLMCK